jgi:hypothetical protein
LDAGKGRPHLVSKPGHGAPFTKYALGAAYDEMFGPDGSARAHYAGLYLRLSSLPPEVLNRRLREADCNKQSA